MCKIFSMRLKLGVAVLFVALCFLAIFALKVYSIGNSKSIKVFVLGELDDIPDSIFNKLPPGFQHLTNEKAEEIGDIIIDTYSNKNPRALFQLTEGVTNIDEILNWAKEQGKSEIYLMVPEPPDPNTEVMGLRLDDIIDRIIPNAHANSVPGPTSCSGSTVPAGSCILYPGQGIFVWWYTATCFQYSAKFCHTAPMADHINKNTLALSNHASATSTVDCMRSHNGGSSFMNPPTFMRIDVYKNSTDYSNLAECPSGSIACADVGTLQGPPRVSTGKRIRYRQDILRNNRWDIVHHEVLHTYGYEHPATNGQCGDFTNIDSAPHCCSSHEII